MHVYNGYHNPILIDDGRMYLYVIWLWNLKKRSFSGERERTFHFVVPDADVRLFVVHFFFHYYYAFIMFCSAAHIRIWILSGAPNQLRKGKKLCAYTLKHNVYVYIHSCTWLYMCAYQNTFKICNMFFGYCLNSVYIYIYIRHFKNR